MLSKLNPILIVVIITLVLVIIIMCTFVIGIIFVELTSNMTYSTSSFPPLYVVSASLLRRRLPDFYLMFAVDHLLLVPPGRKQLGLINQINFLLQHLII